MKIEKMRFDLISLDGIPTADPTKAQITQALQTSLATTAITVTTVVLVNLPVTTSPDITAPVAYNPSWISYVPTRVLQPPATVQPADTASTSSESMSTTTIAIIAGSVVGGVLVVVGVGVAVYYYRAGPSTDGAPGAPAIQRPVGPIHSSDGELHFINVRLVPGAGAHADACGNYTE
jgi:hypothetical protein